MSKPSIGISECLTNSVVRYDQKSQFNKALIDVLEEIFIIEPICPEVECGLGVPRPPVQLVTVNNKINVIGRDNKNVNVTQQLMKYSKNKVAILDNLSGYIFKAKSPSCGVMTTPIYNIDGDVIEVSNGIFVGAIVKQYPNLPIIDDAELETKDELCDFIDRVIRYSNRI